MSEEFRPMPHGRQFFGMGGWKTHATYGLQGFPWLSPMVLMIFVLLVTTMPGYALECPPEQYGLVRRIPTAEKAFNPNPSPADIVLPMPCGGSMVLRHVCVPAEGFFGDLRLDLGCADCGRENFGFMEGRRKASVSGPFTLDDMPTPWREKLERLAVEGDGRCPAPGDMTATGFYYFIGKYEITQYQWNAVMGDQCPDADQPLSVDDPRPKTDISWFEAVEFTRRYTEWLLKNAPAILPRFSGGRFAYIRLPTEAEWEYAARGGQEVSAERLNREEFFPTYDRPVSDFAVFTAPEAAKPPERMAWIGSKCANPLGLFDVAGNAAEMVLDPFRFSLGFRLHGATGGFISKGGSYRKRQNEIMPGRREEMPFYLEDGAFRSNDLGFRVVLSAIVTPRDRTHSLSEQWAAAGPNETPDADGVQTNAQDRENDSAMDWYRGMLSPEASGQERPTATPSIAAQQQAESLKSVVRSALFTAESAISYAMRRQVMAYELERVKNLRKKNLPEPILEDLELNIAKAGEALDQVDRSIDGFLQFYVHRIMDGLNYPEPFFDAQMDAMYAELAAEEGFSQSLRSRLELFQIYREHVALLKTDAPEFDMEVVIRDILPGSY